MMQSGSYAAGRFVREDGTGIQGLTVEVWLHREVDKQLAATHTDRRGRFAVSYRVAGKDKPHLDDAEVFVTVRDRGQRMVHSSVDALLPLLKPAIFDVRLGSSTLAGHDAGPLDWHPSTPRPQASELMADISDAVRLLGDDSPRYAKLAERGLCPGPILTLLETLPLDAGRTLDGDPAARQRFVESLALASRYMDHHAEHLRENIDLLLPGPTHSGAPSERSAVDIPGPRHGRVEASDKIIVLLAGLTIGEGEPNRTRAALQTAVGVVCEFGHLGLLHDAAHNALIGGRIDRDRFRNLLDMAEFDCGPDDGPMPDSGGLSRPCLPWDPFFDEGCLVADVRRLLDLPELFRNSHATYEVTEVDPPRACPGEAIVIRGNRFGAAPGEVVFNRHGGGHVWATPESWTDDEVVVTVPEGAGCGLRLDIQNTTAQVCGRFIDLKKSGLMTATFDGSAADIHAFRVNGAATTVCVHPGTPLVVAWEVCASDERTIEVLDDQGQVVDVHVAAAQRGSWRFAGTGFPVTTRLTVRLRVGGRCEPAVTEQEVTVWIDRMAELTVQGMEVTQAIQHFRAAQHLTFAADRGPDNSIALVSDKPAWVRVYLRSGQDPSFNGGQLPQVTGTLRVSSRARVFGVGIAQSATLLPVNVGAVTAEANPVYAAERGDSVTTLNFVVPGDIMRGRVHIQVDVSAPSGPCRDEPYLASAEETVVVARLQRLRVAGILVRYDGPISSTDSTNMDLAAPTLNDLRITATRAYELYPAASPRTADLRSAGTLTLTYPLDDPRSNAGGCSTNWGTFLNELTSVRTLDGNRADWVYYGLLPAGTPLNVPGCGRNGLGAAAVNVPGTMAHEIGHGLNLPHAPCGNVGTGIDTTYPAYEPHDPPNTPQASIGEYGLDITTGNVFSPVTTQDIMSYCGPRWISLHNHGQLIGAGRLNPVEIGSGSGDMVDPADVPLMPMISILGHVNRDTGVEVELVGRMRTRAEVVGGESTDLRAELLDAEGRLLASSMVHRLVEQGGCGCGSGAGDEPSHWAFQSLVPDVARGAALRIRHGQGELWRREAPGQPPAVRIKQVSIDKEGQLYLEWDGEAYSPIPPRYTLRWQTVDGEDSGTLAVGVRGHRTRVDLTHVPVSDVVVQLLLDDGFSTAAATTEPLQLPRQSARPVILQPQEGTRLSIASPLRLWCLADEGGSARTEDAVTYRWYVDGEEVGSGTDLWVPAPSPGSHHVACTLQRGREQATSDVTFTVETSA